MKLQKIVSRLQELHPKEIDLSLDRIINLCKKLGNPQDKIKAISIVGTNGKYSTIQAMFSILKEANFKCNVYTSPHIKSIARLQEIKSGKLKALVKDHQLFLDGSHNPLGAKVLNEYLDSLDCNKHIILGMMANKDHNEYMSFFKDIATLTTIDIPNQPNSIKGEELKDKLNSFSNINYKESIEDAIKSIPVKENDIILITGSLYLAGEVLNCLLYTSDAADE